MLDSARFMPKPIIAVLAGKRLFESFFDESRRARLSRFARWTLISTPDASAAPLGGQENRRRSNDRSPAVAKKMDMPLDGRRGSRNDPLLSADNRRTESTTSLIPLLANKDALITTWDSPYLSAALMKEIRSVKVIAHCGGEVKRRFETSLLRDLVVVNTPGPMSRPTAELGATLLLYAARNVDHYRQTLRSNSNQIYKDFHAAGGGTESLLGREVGMIGCGRIGRALIELLRAFDVRWRVYDPFASRELASGLPVHFDSLNGVLRRSSLLAITAAATEKTRHLLNRERLAALADGTAVVNIARGSLIDLDALTDEVKMGRLRCALDVTDPEEPLPVGHPLRKLPGAIVTPHIGGGGEQTRRQMADVAMDELERFFRGEPVLNRVTPVMLRRMT